MPTTPDARLLIVTGAAVADEAELPPLIRSLIRSATAILVVTPALPGRLQWLASDTDRVQHEADKRLEVVLGQVETLVSDVETSGRIGDDTPLSAFADSVRDFSPDHILIALRSAERKGWQERHLAERVLEAFHIPLTIFEIDGSGRVTTPITPPAGS